MRIAWATTRPWDLAAVAGLVVVAAMAAILEAPSWLRIPVGLLFVLAAPGYAFVAALYPERHQESEVAVGEDDERKEALRRGLSPLERVALSLGLSIAIVPLLGLALNYTPFGIRLVPVILTVGAFTILCLGVAAWRRQRLAPQDRFGLAIVMEGPAWQSRTAADKILTIALVASVVFAAGSLVYVLATPRIGEAFTEFYILGPTGKAACYPARYTEGEYRSSDADIAAGCPVRIDNITVGIVNHEGRDVTYHLRVLWTKETRLADNTTRVDEVWTASQKTILLPSVPVDLSLNATFKPQHEEAIVLPAPPTSGTLRLSLQIYLEPPAPAAPSVDLLQSPYRRLHVWIGEPLPPITTSSSNP